MDNLPTDKLYYSIGEVAVILGVNTSLIRYWEKEFLIIKPSKNRKGDRRYILKDIEGLKKIYKLVKEKGHTIEGAKRALIESDDNFVNVKILNKLKLLREELIQMKSTL